MGDFNHQNKINRQDFKNNGSSLGKSLTDEPRKALAPPLPKIIDSGKQTTGLAPKSRKWKKFFSVTVIILSLVFFLIAVIAGLYYYTDITKRIIGDDLIKVARINIAPDPDISQTENKIADKDKEIWTEYADASGLFKFSFPPGFKKILIKEGGIVLFNSVALNGQIKIEITANDKKLGAQELLDEFKENDTSGMVFHKTLAEINGYQYYCLGQYERGLSEKYSFPINDRIVVIDFSFFAQAFSTKYSPAKDRILIQNIIKTIEFIKPTESTSAGAALVRDEKRLADIENIRTSLEKYYQDINKYPPVLSWGESLSWGEETVYLSVLPNDPDSEKSYQYRSFNGLVYALVFELEVGNDQFKRGEYIATSDKLEEISDIDNDGLYDREEELYGTDENKADSDGDGYDDLSELIRGYNPIGPGMLEFR